MKGTLFGIGVGPGDPELLTVKAINQIKSCEVLALPISDPKLSDAVYEEVSGDSPYSELLANCTAYQIVLPMLPEIADKPKLYMPMPMVKDVRRLKQVHDACARAAGEQLEKGKDIAFITLGDPTIYSTCLYVKERVDQMGYQTALTPGIPSFCAAAARMNIGLVENRDELHILPGSYDIKQGLSLPGTKVLMKIGSKMPEVKEYLKEQAFSVKMVENCGMEEEHIYQNLDDIPDHAGYFSLMVVKEEEHD